MSEMQILAWDGKEYAPTKVKGTAYRGFFLHKAVWSIGKPGPEINVTNKVGCSVVKEIAGLARARKCVDAIIAKLSPADLERLLTANGLTVDAKSAPWKQICKAMRGIKSEFEKQEVL